MDLFSTRVVVSERKFHIGAICNLRTDWVWIQPLKISTKGPLQIIILVSGRWAHGRWHTYGNLCTRHYKAKTARLVFIKTIARLKTTERCSVFTHAHLRKWILDRPWGCEAFFHFKSVESFRLIWLPCLATDESNKRRNKVLNQLTGVPMSWMGCCLIIEILKVSSDPHRNLLT